jgi:DHA2 family multidrug resistance protein
MGSSSDDAGLDPRAWIAVAGAVFGTFMALLDVSVTNASLPQIQGEIGATGTEGTWIGTGYLVAEIIMIPLTGWFSRLLGLRSFLLLSALLFTLFSVMCGLAGNLTQMIVGRVGQGFFGGGLIPSSLTIIATRLTPAQRPLGLAIFASVALVAPVAGPVLGGWLTESASWQWLFFMNLPIAVVLIGLLLAGLERGAPDWRQLRQADWLGILGLALGLGGLTVVLEEGQRENWFDSDLIRLLTGVSALGLLLIVATQIRHPHPVVNFRLLLRRSHAALFVIMGLVGVGGFSLLYVVPVFLATISGYNAAQTGLVSTSVGLASLLAMPLVTPAMARLDTRWIVGAGLALLAAGALMNLGLTADSAGGDFFWGLFLIGAGQTFVALPLSQVATAGLPDEQVPDGTALFSMARNLGGSLGLALTGVLIDRRMSFHAAQIGQATTANDPLAQERLAGLAAGLAGHGADAAFTARQALSMVAGEVQRQALVMTYTDGFWILGIGVLLMIPSVLLLGRQRPGTGGGMMH